MTDDGEVFDVKTVVDGGIMLYCTHCQQGIFIMDHNLRMLMSEHDIESHIKDHKRVIRAQAAYNREMSGARNVPTS